MFLRLDPRSLRLHCCVFYASVPDKVPSFKGKSFAERLRLYTKNPMTARSTSTPATAPPITAELNPLFAPSPFGALASAGPDQVPEIMSKE
jgi:hypothetical protein